MSRPERSEVRAWAEQNLSNEPSDELGGYSPRECIVNDLVAYGLLLAERSADMPFDMWVAVLPLSPHQHSYGQHVFEQLYSVKPTLARLIAGTVYDPVNDDLIIPKFFAYVRKNWHVG